MQPECNIVSIGSTASIENVDQQQLGYPNHSISKALQQNVMNQLQRENKNMKFATLTCGWMAEDKNAMPFEDIAKTIEYVTQMSSASVVREIILYAKSSIT